MTAQDRIAEALERIALALEAQASKPQKKPRRAITPAEQAHVNRAIDAKLRRMGAGKR